MRALSVLLLLASCAGPQVVIHRDAFGVPHVEGPTDASVVFGLTYARAEDEFQAIESGLLLCLGRYAEVAGEEGLAWDRLVHSLDLPGRARAEYARLPEEERVLCDAAADALNLYLSTFPEVKPRLLERFEPWHFVASGYALHLHQVGEAVGALDRPRADGSNAWALAPSRTTSGNAMLLANPHIPLGNVYEAHVHSAEGLHVSGMLAYGRGLLPAIGFNERIAWTLTVNRPDTVDLYAVKLDGDTYEHGDEVREVTERQVTLQVQGSDDHQFVVRSTHHGPILSEQNGVAYVARVAGLDRGGLLGQSYALARAGSVGEAFEAFERRALLFHNVVVADASGSIGYLYNAAIPKRNDGHDWGRVVDGNDPSTDWLGLHPVAELPQVVDPECGFVQNCNSPPWETTATGSDPRPEDFPEYMVGNELRDARLPMSLELLGRDESFDFEEWQQAAFDPTIHDPTGLLPHLLGELVGHRKEEVGSAGARLAVWDRRSHPESVEATWYLLWLERVAGYATPQGELDPSRLPPGVAVRNFVRVLEHLEEQYSTLEVAWGEINRHQRPIDGAWSDERASEPCAGAHAWAGTTFCFLARRPEGCRRRYGFHGNSYVAAIELTPDGPRARTLIDFGQSTDPSSPHFDDQAALYARGEMKAAPFTRAEVRAATRRSYSPGDRP